MRRSLLSFLLASILAPAIHAAELLPAKRVVVFKNGIGFVTRAGSVEFKGGWASLPEIPQASYGTLWLAGDDGAPLDEIIAGTEVASTERTAASLAELLAANAGAQITLTLRGGREVSGTITLPAAAIETAAASHLVLESGGRFVAVPKDEIVSAGFAGKPRQSIAQPGTRSVLRMRSGSRDGGAGISLSYLQKGIGWTPEYTVRLEDGAKARISMKGVLVNDAIELSGTEILFAVGFPSFVFADVPTPLDVQQSLAEFFSRLRGDGRYYETNAMSNVMSQSVVIPRRGGATAGGDFDSSAAAGVSGEAEQDLFLYTRGGVSLRKGERGAYALFSAAAPYTHVFEWEIPDTSSINSMGYPGSESATSAKLEDQVWHSLRIENSSKFPWTTGPAIVLDGANPVAQNTLHYTARGSSTMLKLTVAPDVGVTRDEVEASRQPNALTRFGNRYDAVTLDGKLDVSNFRGERISLSIRKTLTGTVATSSDGGKPARLAVNPRAINPTSRIEWTIPLDAGATKTITYRYVVHVRD